jgi:hypothetical protein
MAPPVIYSLKIPDIVYMPACYMSALEINNLGNTSDYQFPDKKFRTIPEAYDFSMTFTSLLIPSRNILRALDNNDVVEAINNVEGMRQIVRDLAREGYRIATNDGNTPLIWAVRLGHERVVHSLISCNADFNLRNYQNKNALTYAVELSNSDVIDVLLKAGSDVNY